MIEEVISEILAAEEMAEKIKTEAEQAAGSELSDAEKRACDVQNATAAKVKARKIKRLAAAAKNAEAEYLKITDTSYEEASALINEYEKNAQTAGENIYRRILNGDC